ncbi:MAG: TlpA family protein disulfide reductase [Saprospiraceae bacterium]|nr:TlpA family protein disulfide reductase [Saprospiraceae bacterium]
MKKALLLFCLSGWIISAKAAFVSGTIKNTEPGSKVVIHVPHYFLDGKTSAFPAQLDDQLRFSIEVKMMESGLAFLEFNDDRLPIFLGKDDSLILKTDAFQFPVVAAFSGKNGANNRLYQDFLKQNQLDFNEFNNIRFKIGQTWITVEDAVNGLMESLTPELFKSAMDAQKDAALALIDEFNLKNPDAITPEFSEWLHAEMVYTWAYHLLIYGQVYAYKYDIQPGYFDFLFDAPITSSVISSSWYRQFVVAFMARQQVKTGAGDGYWSGQYYLAEQFLSGKSLAFFRSEMISTAFSPERLAEILPLYNHFLQKNPFAVFDEKIAGLYQKYAHEFPGTAAPAFEVFDIEGHTLNLRQFNGKIVYLNFWASWCGACLRKMDFFDEFEPELREKGVIVLNVSIDDNRGNWETAVFEHGFRGYHILSEGKKLAAAYGVEAIPQYFIIGKTGLFEAKPFNSQPKDIRQKLLDLSANR